MKMKTNLQIQNVEMKISKNNKPFAKINTSEGLMSCFDAKTLLELDKLVGKTVVAEVETKGSFRNIIAIDSLSDVQKPIVAAGSDIRMNSMVVSYVKDLVCAGKVKIEDFEKTCKQLLGFIKTL